MQTKTHIRFWLAIATMAAAPAFPVLAAEAGLYDAPPPPDAAYVRVLNASTASLDVAVADAAYTVAPATMSPYEYVSMGSYEASWGASKLAVSLTPQKFYTIVVPDDGTAATLVEDEALANPSRAGLYFYNVTGKPLQLDAKMGGQQAAVFKDVAPGTSTFREVKPFEVAFVVVDGGAPAVELPTIAMLSAQGTSVVALPGASGLTAIQSTNSVETE